MRILGLLAFLVLLGARAIPLWAGYIFIAGEVPVGTLTPFVDEVNGISATFSSEADPGGFMTLGYSFGSSPEDLWDTQCACFDGNPGGVVYFPNNLYIEFSVPVSSISMDVQTAPGFQVFLETSTCNAVAYYPADIISCSGAAFENVELLTGQLNWGIADVSVTPASPVVPEPDCMILMLSGAIGLGLFSLARRSQRLGRKSS